MPKGIFIFEGNVVGIALLLARTFLKECEKLSDYDRFSLIQY